MWISVAFARFLAQVSFQNPPNIMDGILGLGFYHVLPVVISAPAP